MSSGNILCSYLSLFKKPVYFLNANIANTTPKIQIPIQEMIVALQPRLSETRAIPYIDTAAPIYVHALQQPLTVDALPVFLNLPGTQEIKRKLHECINAQTMQARSKHIILQAELFTFIKKQRGIQRTIESPKRMPAPLTSLLNTLPLCIALTANKLIIEKIGNATETKIEFSLVCSKTSLYSVGSQLSIPSRIKPMAIMQTNIGKTPFLIKIWKIDVLLSSAFSSGFSDFTEAISLISAFFGKTKLMDKIKIKPATIQKTVEVKNTNFHDIIEMQSGAYKYKTIVDT